ELLGPRVPARGRAVPRPDPALLNSPVVRADRPSIVKVTGVAFSCNRRIEGSGFVYAEQRVMTNAHVVAGVGRPEVQLSTGARLAAVVVLYDPDTDIAVLRVPGLPVPPLRFASRPAVSRQDAIVAGFPEDRDVRSLFVGPARIRDTQRIRGPNIYSTRTVVREAYAIRGPVRSGNSGGPLLAKDGSVLGVIFAAALDDPDTGFVLTAGEVAAGGQSGASAGEAVGTGPCD